MAYWWVSQNHTYRQERAGGFLWAPNKDAAGRVPFHWATMHSVRAGDVVFSYVGQAIVSVSVAKAPAVDSKRPSDFSPGNWVDDGQLIRVEYRDLAAPLTIASVASELFSLLPEKYSPLTAGGTGNQGYLFAIPPRAGRFLLERIDEGGLSESADVVEDGIESAVARSTERRALILSRIGQGQFREDLLNLWGGRCAVTQFDVIPLLRASHIKPWRDSDNAERLDAFNGLLLSPAYDAAFDAGYISFEDDGRLMFCSDLEGDRARTLGIDPAARVVGIRPQHGMYLQHHRGQVFRDGSPAVLGRRPQSSTIASYG